MIVIVSPRGNAILMSVEDYQILVMCRKTQGGIMISSHLPGLPGIPWVIPKGTQGKLEMIEAILARY